MASRNSLVMAALFALAAAASAQEAGPGTAKADPEGPTFEDLKNSLGELEGKRAREDDEKRDAAVQKNQQETLRIYSETLGKRNGDVDNVTKRLEVNRALHAKYSKLYDQARAEMATLQAQYINRTVALKKTLDQGKLSKEAYEKLLEEDTKRYRNREKELAEDIASYEEEVRIASRQQKDLGLKKELLEFDPFGDEKVAAETKKRANYADRMRRTVDEMSGFRVRSVVETLR